MTYRAYAGIGSRDTPEFVLNWMRKLGGYLLNQGWTLRSGSADGADLAFEHGLNREFDHNTLYREVKNPKEIYLPWPGFMGSFSELHPGLYPFTEEEVSAAAHFHPAWDRCSEAAKKLHTRNVRQIVGLRAIHEGQQIPAKFVVCWTEGGQLKGGTSQALRIAEYLEIPIFNLGRAADESDLRKILEELDAFQQGL